MPNRAQRRASGTDYPASLSEWEHDGIRTVTLPARSNDAKSFVVDYEIPNLWAYLALGRVPNPLAPLASRVHSEFIVPETLSQDEQADYYRLQCHVIGTHLRKPNLVEELGSDDAAAQWVAEHFSEAQMLLLWSLSVHFIDMDEFGEKVGGLLNTVRFRDKQAGEDVPEGRDDDGAVAV